MNSSRFRLRALLFAMLLCGAGCAADRVATLPAPRAQALEHNRRGVEAEARGDRDLALAEFDEALRLQSSIENGEGMVVALVNGARTLRLKGDVAAARQKVERAAALLPQGSDLAAEVFYEKAKVLAAAGELKDARDWAARSGAEEKGEALGRRLNLLAALMLRLGSTDEAREKSEQALQANRKVGLKGEEANSLRLLGEIHLLQDRHALAEEGYRQALALDKELGLSGKIAADLAGLGAVFEKRGDAAGAVGWYRRSLAVSESARDAARSRALIEALARLYRQNGEVASAREMEEKRKLLTSPVR